MKDLDFVPTKVDIEVRKQTVYLGAGLTTTYWLVTQDGVSVDAFRHFIDAKNYADARRRDWESNDE
jgi:hypothetical protein